MKLSSATLTSFVLLVSQASAFSTNNSGINAITRSSVPFHTIKSLSGTSTLLHAAIAPEAPVAEAKDSTELEAEDSSSKSYLDDGFVFGLEGSGLERPKGKVSQVVLEGDSLETKPYQAAFVSATLLSHAAFSFNAIATLSSMNGGHGALTLVQAVATIVSSWAVADLGSGILHWSVDNYGNGRTPIMGGIISAFQGHHSAPWTITEREFCNNVHKLCIPFGIPTVAAISFLAGPSHPMVSLFFAVFCTMEIMSQEFHKWAHMTPKQLNPVIMSLQKLNLTIGRISHAQHHIAPYDGNYCIVSGVWNKVLDESGFFRKLERIVYKMNGIESNSWKLDAKLRQKTLAGDYTL